MRAGQLNRRVTIERKTDAKDAFNQPLPDAWETLATVWASILHKSGAEAIKADAGASIVQASIRIRYRADITAGMRVKHGAVVYAINAVLPDEVRREYVDLVCEVVQ
ncbi:MAG: phage head closure protein [Alcaligenaceae bacterium]|nr:phage head closure protein [Alcaligenaceae bacterium]